eukprot:5371433-Amphidinium_carterae.1
MKAGCPRPALGLNAQTDTGRRWLQDDAQSVTADLLDRVCFCAMRPKAYRTSIWFHTTGRLPRLDHYTLCMTQFHITPLAPEPHAYWHSEDRDGVTVIIVCCFIISFAKVRAQSLEWSWVDHLEHSLVMNFSA